MSKTTNKFSPEFRERTVRLGDGQPRLAQFPWQAIMLIFAKIGQDVSDVNANGTV